MSPAGSAETAASPVQSSARPPLSKVAVPIFKMGIQVAMFQAIALYMLHYFLNSNWGGRIPYLAFRQLTPDLYQANFTYVETQRQRIAHIPITTAPEYPGSVYMIKDGTGWVLVDTGVSEAVRPGFPTGLEWAVGNLTQQHGGELKLIYLTHGHAEHIGALFELMRAFPGAAVGFHLGEKFYLNDKQSYGDVVSDNPLHRLWQHWEGEISTPMPLQRCFYLQDMEGDLADLATLDGVKPAWVPTSGLVKYYHTSGHSPGHTVLLVPGTKTLLAGDLFNYVRPPALVFTQPPVVSTVTDIPMYLYDPNEAQQSVDNILSLDWDTAYPTHTIGGAGVKRSELVEQNKIPKVRVLDYIQDVSQRAKRSLPGRVLYWCFRTRLWRLFMYIVTRIWRILNGIAARLNKLMPGGGVM